MEAIRIVIPGIPVVWRAPTVTRRGAFSPKAEEKKIARWFVQAQYSGKPIEGPIQLAIHFEMPIPASFSKAKRARLIGTPHLSRPDTTNLQKFAEDCLSGIVFPDDNQVWQIFSDKIYSENPKTVIYVR